MIKQLSKAIVASLVFESRVLCAKAKGGSVTWITPKPTSAPTDEFPSMAPASIQLVISSQPTTEPPFFTSLPTTHPSIIDTSTKAKPGNDVPAVEGEKPKLFNASKSSKDPKASKLHPSTPNKTPPAIYSPTYSPSLASDVTSNPSSAPQRPNSSDCASAKWHPNLSFNKCTNSPEYPNHWVSTPAMQRHYFRATLEQCCAFVFGPIGTCEFEDVCFSASPSSSPSNRASGVHSDGPSDAMTVKFIKKMQQVWLFDANFVYCIFSQQRPSLAPSARKELAFPTAHPSPEPSEVSYMLVLWHLNFLSPLTSRLFLAKAPSSAPGEVLRDTLPPTVVGASTSSPTTSVDPLVKSSQPIPPVICTCSPTEVSFYISREPIQSPVCGYGAHFADALGYPWCFC